MQKKQEMATGIARLSYVGRELRSESTLSRCGLLGLIKLFALPILSGRAGLFTSNRQPIVRNVDTSSLLRRVNLFVATVAVSLGFGLSTVVADTVTYKYDDAGRLKSSVYNAGPQRNYVLDAAGNRTTSNAILYGLPTVPTGLTKGTVTATSVALSWTASTDTNGPGLAGYIIFRNGTQIGTATTTSYTDTTAHDVTTYSYTVAAYDTAGNQSSPSTAVSATTPDGTSPGAPGVPTVTNIVTTTATANWTPASDNVGVTRYRYNLNGGAWVTLGNVLTINLSGLTSRTTYSFNLQAGDAAGYWGATATKSFTTFITETATMTVGTDNSVGDFGIFGYGYQSGGVGTISPATLSSGSNYVLTYSGFWDEDWTSTNGPVADGYITIGGFPVDPGAGWLLSASVGGVSRSGASASYSYSSGTASWYWPNAGFGIPTSGTLTVSATHR